MYTPSRRRRALLATVLSWFPAILGRWILAQFTAAWEAEDQALDDVDRLRELLATERRRADKLGLERNGARSDLKGLAEERNQARAVNVSLRSGIADLSVALNEGRYDSSEHVEKALGAILAREDHGAHLLEDFACARERVAELTAACAQAAATIEASAVTIEALGGEDGEGERLVAAELRALVGREGLSTAEPSRLAETELALHKTLRKLDDAQRLVEVMTLTQAQGYQRPAVVAFADAMEERLRANDYKGGWSMCEPGWLLTRLRDEVEDVRRELCKCVSDRNPDQIRRDAADVANFAMMIVDNCGGLPRGDENRSAATSACATSTRVGCNDAEDEVANGGEACTERATWPRCEGCRNPIDPMTTGYSYDEDGCYTCAVCVAGLGAKRVALTSMTPEERVANAKERFDEAMQPVVRHEPTAEEVKAWGEAFEAAAVMLPRETLVIGDIEQGNVLREIGIPTLWDVVKIDGKFAKVACEDGGEVTYLHKASLRIYRRWELVATSREAMVPNSTATDNDSTT